MVDFYYKQYGKGMNNLILFHGFGEDHWVFDELIQDLIRDKTDLTCYAIDIFYHGESTRDDKKLTKDDWKQCFERFLHKEKIREFSMLGFSLGGRFAISTAMSFPEQTKLILLIAPDGIYQSLWYRIANTKIGNPIFSALMSRPRQFNWFIRFWKMIRIVPKPLIKFVESVFQSEAQRSRIYRTWTYFHPLQYRTRELSDQFNRFEIPLILILGADDAVVLPEKVLKKLQSIDALEYKILPVKHHQLISQSKNHIISILKDRIL